MIFFLQSQPHGVYHLIMFFPIPHTSVKCKRGFKYLLILLGDNTVKDFNLSELLKIPLITIDDIPHCNVGNGIIPSIRETF